MTEKAASYQTEELRIRREIFQGDSLSSRWFCLAVNILSKILNRSAYGYSINDITKLSHLFYMDDLKLYARGRKQLEGELELVRKFSEDIGMSFGLQKCAVIEVKRGKMVEGGNIRISDGREIAELSFGERYKYLGIQQTYEIKQRENKEGAKNELMRRVRTQLSAKNKIEALNIWAIPSFTYTAGVLTWSKTDLQQMDRGIRTTLTEHGMLHPNSATERLYLPRKQGGRGLTSIEQACLQEETHLRAYFRGAHLPVHRWVATQRDIHILDREEGAGEPETENRIERLELSWQAKAPHGRFYASLHQPEVDLAQSNTYLTLGYLYPQTEGTLFAIQDQVVPTRNYSKYIMKLPVENTKCRLCSIAEETVQHISSACSAIAATKYLARHNNMGKVVHQLLGLQFQLLPHFTPHHLYSPQTLMENENFKLYWDMTVITDIGMEHNRPDVVVWNKMEKTVVILDFAVPLDCNLKKSYGEKINKYEALSRQMRDMWKLNRVDIKPLIISTNGLVHKNTVKHLRELKLPEGTITWMQKAVILGTVNIIRQVIYPH
ncbi:uncharacterized protein LOC123311715 [Coccinella septempunctata]|uniref:uncharacterized protein LOC123311715 n=1 Tax=Coccinella septempunctata TaxID=41139 RepID=UPI001D06C847|nr:uncharacterized protein LOC123311715 [Coccinella septempunctata]